MSHITILEPFYGGSHKQLIDLLLGDDGVLNTDEHQVQLLTLPDKKWKWRARTSSIHFGKKIRKQVDVFFCSSMLNLAEVMAIAPQLISAKKIYYFHENQIVYPERFPMDRDIQFAWMQILSCYVADKICWNSSYNLNSFIDGIRSWLRLMPHDQCPDIAETQKMIMEKSEVMYYPITVPPDVRTSSTPPTYLHIVWNHRWEWDKGPKEWFEAVDALLADDFCKDKFKISVLGESFAEVPEPFLQKDKYAAVIEHWGYQPTKQDYYNILYSADVVVSTTWHEFFGVSILEAIACGCYPVCPKRLVFPEYLPPSYLYNTQTQLVKKLKNLIKRPETVRNRLTWAHEMPTEQFQWLNLKPKYSGLFNPTVEGGD